MRAHVQLGCTKKRCAIKPGLIACAHGLNPPATKRKIGPRPGHKTRGNGFRARSERRKRAKLCKSGTETLQAKSAGQT
ncbi:hypothetical protein PF003_g10320 [Phytophthora fragariae]|nr:hypothetical protein PF003_g10320 [Phytophthora fragariae]